MCFFFFKQKTAYEMRISDWSSDVCSSDLERRDGAALCALARHFGAEGRRDRDTRSAAARAGQSGMARSGLHPGDERRRGRSGEDREGDDARPGLRGVAALLRTACRVVRGQSCVRRSFRGIAADGDPDRRRETGPDIARAYDRDGADTTGFGRAVTNRTIGAARPAGDRKAQAARNRATPARTDRAGDDADAGSGGRSEEHTSELQSLMRISYAVFCLKKKNTQT